MLNLLSHPGVPSIDSFENSFCSVFFYFTSFCIWLHIAWCGGRDKDRSVWVRIRTVWDSQHCDGLCGISWRKENKNETKNFTSEQYNMNVYCLLKIRCWNILYILGRFMSNVTWDDWRHVSGNFLEIQVLYSLTISV